MTNTKMLKAAMTLFGDTQSDLASYFGISRQAINRKCNGKASFNTDEIDAMIERYKLSPDAVVSIFFADRVN